MMIKDFGRTYRTMVAITLMAGLFACSNQPSPPLTAEKKVVITVEDYHAAERLLEGNLQGLVKNIAVNPHWLKDNKRFWYRRDGDKGPEYVVVDATNGLKLLAFDHEALAAALGKVLKRKIEAHNLGLSHEILSDDLKSLEAVVYKKAINCDLVSMVCNRTDVTAPQKGLLLSHSGTFAVTIREDNLLLVDLKTGVERALTTDGAPYYSYGKLLDASEITILLKKNQIKLPPFDAVLSPDDHYLIVPRIDEREVASTPYVEWVPTDGSQRPILHRVRGAFIGDLNAPKTDIFIVNIGTGEAIRVKLPEGYTKAAMDVPVLGWSLARKQVFMIVRSPGSQKLALLRVDLVTGTSTIVIEEVGKTRVESNSVEYNRPNIRILGDGDEVIWFSDRTGWGHLYRYDAQSGILKNAITSGNWLVQDIHQLDMDKREIYFTGGGREPGRDPYFRHLYKASLDGGGVTLLTDTNADHHYSPDPVPMMTILTGSGSAESLIQPSLGVLIDTYSTVDQPPVTLLRSTEDGHVITELEVADASRLYAQGWKAPIRKAVKAADGVTDIYTVYYAPGKTLPDGKHPVIDAAYGGPQLIVAPRNFIEAYSNTLPLGQSALARLGFAVVTIDGRGTPLRSNNFRDKGFPEFTQVGIDDHIAAIKNLAEENLEMDINRVGVFGWSWGGTFSAQAILSRPEFYKVAVSGAGIYDYAGMMRGVQSIDNYIGVPVYSNGSNYRTSVRDKPLNWDKLDITRMAGGLEGQLLLIYGDMDENVPQNQTFQLINSLMKANKPYDLLYLPNRNHNSGQEGYVIQRKMNYFVEHLLDATSPKDVTFSHYF